MPASRSAIRTNIARIRGAEEGYQEVPEIKALLDEVLEKIPEEPENYADIWDELIAKADAQRIADKIPGTVGRIYKGKYGKTKPRSPHPKFAIKITQAAQSYILQYMDVEQEDGTTKIYDGINKLIHPCARMRQLHVSVLSPYAFKKALRRSVSVNFETDKDRAWATQIVDGIVRRVEDAESEGY